MYGIFTYIYHIQSVIIGIIRDHFEDPVMKQVMIS